MHPQKTRVHIPDQICAFYTIRYKIIPPSTPQINGKFERSRRKGQEEDNFSDWITKYNWKRPHGDINMQTLILKLYKRLKNYNNSLLVVIEKLATYFFARTFELVMYLVNTKLFTLHVCILDRRE
ncbi:MAG: hypothetical protein SWO11_09405 [Thermodesulfobacteriota bacterium]|nr:hypothetical protein [Thermodesulfobacteriota bacterium]